MSYTPDRGHIVWLDFDPQSGREQAGRRPALILTDAEYNRKTSLCVACPITSKVKGYPFEVPLNAEALVRGVVLSDQVKSLDWVQRHASYAEVASANVIDEVSELLSTLLHLDG